MSDSNFDGVLDPEAGWPDIPQASTQFVVLGGQGGPLNEQAKNLAARTKKLKADIDNISVAGFGGQYKNLAVIVSGTGYAGTITADGIVAESSDYKTSVIRGLNVSFNGATAGAGGLDTGVIAANTWYYIHVIYNPTSAVTAALLSLSATAPTLPTGYSRSAMIGAARSVDGAFLQSTQVDNNVLYMTSVVSANFTQVLNNGNATTPTAFSVSSVVPPIAKTCTLNCNVTYVSTRGYILIGSLDGHTYGTFNDGRSGTICVDVIFSKDIYYKLEYSDGSMSNYVVGYAL